MLEPPAGHLHQVGQVADPENNQGHFPSQALSVQTAEVGQTPLQPHGKHRKAQEKLLLTGQLDHELP